MNYKIHVSAYLKDTNQLLVSFSSDDTAHEAADYQSLAFDITGYGDATADEVIAEIAKLAPTICSDIVTSESFTATDEKSASFSALVGQSYTYSQDELDGLKVV